jgi:acetolactate synthase-1/2/3 large subunit
MQLTGGEAVVRTLEAQGVDTIFGMPGVHNLAIYDALRDSGIRHIVARHEQGAAFMADGYARATGRVGVCLCTSGPALLNTATPLGTAYCDSSPVLCIASQIPSHAIGKEKGYIHECRDQLGCVRPVTAWSERANAVASIPAVLNEAFARMRNGRPRPVAVEIPCDVLDGRDNAKFPPVDATQPAAADGSATQREQIERAVRLLRQARRPIIWAGGGVTISGGSDQVRQLAELLGAPVLTTVQGKGSIPEDHPLALGSTPVHPAVVDYLASCDVMLAVGTRFTEEDTLEFSIQVPPTMIHVEIDPEEVGRNYAPTLGVVGDARHVLGQMLLHLADDSTRSSDRAGLSRAEEVATLRQRILRDCRDWHRPALSWWRRCGWHCRAKPWSSATWRSVPTGAAACSTCTNPAPSSIRGAFAPSDSVSRRVSAPKWHDRIGRWSCSPATAASCSTARSWQYPLSSSFP